MGVIEDDIVIGTTGEKGLETPGKAVKNANFPEMMHGLHLLGDCAADGGAEHGLQRPVKVGLGRVKSFFKRGFNDRKEGFVGGFDWLCFPRFVFDRRRRASIDLRVRNGLGERRLLLRWCDDRCRHGDRRLVHRRGVGIAQGPGFRNLAGGGRRVVGVEGGRDLCRESRSWGLRFR